MITSYLKNQDKQLTYILIYSVLFIIPILKPFSKMIFYKQLLWDQISLLIITSTLLIVLVLLIVASSNTYLSATTRTLSYEFSCKRAGKFCILIFIMLLQFKPISPFIPIHFSSLSNFNVQTLKEYEFYYLPFFSCRACIQKNC